MTTKQLKRMIAEEIQKVLKETSKDNVENFFEPSGYDVGDKKVFSTTFFKLTGMGGIGRAPHRAGDTFLWRKETWKLLADVGRHDFTAERIK
jgi:hypothetical protein